MRKTRIGDKILLLAVGFFLLYGSVGLTFFPAARFSVTERRNLAAFPPFCAEDVASGAYTAALDDYAAERVPFRGACRALQGAAELTLWRGESHGVILCRDGSLCRRPNVNDSVFSQNLTALSRLQAVFADLPVTVAVVPRRIDVRGEVLPTLYRNAREQAVWERLPASAVTFPDATADAYWYRTDHHWTQKGAYFAYARLGGTLGYTPLPSADFSPYTVTESFLGTSAAASGFPLITPDTVSVWRHPAEESYRVLRDGVPATFAGFYDIKSATGPDPYATFLGGNCGVLQIDRGEADTRPLLLVIKDSFANSALPFLAHHYRILAIDPRYCQKIDLAALAATCDRALLLCGMETLTQVPFLSALLKHG